jgi:hypothetical protein
MQGFAEVVPFAAIGELPYSIPVPWFSSLCAASLYDHRRI